MALPTTYDRMAELLKGLMERTAPLYEQVDRAFEDATWVGSRLAEILPVPLSQKQYLLDHF